MKFYSLIMLKCKLTRRVENTHITRHAILVERTRGNLRLVKSFLALKVIVLILCHVILILYDDRLNSSALRLAYFDIRVHECFALELS